MGYRDDDEAQRARADALQNEVRALRAENEKLKETSPKEPQKTTRAAKPEPSSFERRTTNERRYVVVGSAVGAGLLPLLALGVPLALGHGEPRFPFGFLGLVSTLVGGVTLPSTVLRIVFPAVPIMARDNTSGAGLYEVDRPMKTRRILFAIACVAYVLGAVAFFFATKK